MAEATYLCFDYGEKRIGVAVGQRLTCTATPLTVVSVTRGRPDWRAISAIIDEWQPQALVVGHPLQMDGAAQPQTHAAERFSRRLHGRYGLPVHLADERLSTYAARRTGAPARAVDAAAAQLILESWMSESAQDAAAGATMRSR